MKFIFLSVVCLLGAATAKPTLPKQKRDILPGDPRYGTDYHNNHHHVHEHVQGSSELDVALALGGYVGSYTSPDNSVYQNTIRHHSLSTGYGPPNFVPGTPIVTPEFTGVAHQIGYQQDVPAFPQQSTSFKTAENVGPISNSYQTPVQAAHLTPLAGFEAPANGGRQPQDVVEVKPQHSASNDVTTGDTVPYKAQTVQDTTVATDVSAEAYTKANANVQPTVQTGQAEEQPNYGHNLAQPAFNSPNKPTRDPEFYAGLSPSNFGGNYDGIQNYAPFGSGQQSSGISQSSYSTPTGTLTSDSDFDDHVCDSPDKQPQHSNTKPADKEDTIVSQRVQVPNSDQSQLQTPVFNRNQQFPQVSSSGQNGEIPQITGFVQNQPLPQFTGFEQNQQFPQFTGFGQNQQFSQATGFGQNQQFPQVTGFAQNQEFPQTTGFALNQQFPQFLSSGLNQQFPQSTGFGQNQHSFQVSGPSLSQPFPQFTDLSRNLQFPQITDFGRNEQFSQISNFGQNQQFSAIPNFGLNQQVPLFPSSGLVKHAPNASPSQTSDFVSTRSNQFQSNQQGNKHPNHQTAQTTVSAKSDPISVKAVNTQQA